MSSIRDVPAAGNNDHLPDSCHLASIHGEPCCDRISRHARSTTLLVTITHLSALVPTAHEISAVSANPPPICQAVTVHEVRQRRGAGEGAPAGGLRREDAQQADAAAPVRRPGPAGALHLPARVVGHESCVRTGAPSLGGGGTRSLAWQGVSRGVRPCTMVCCHAGLAGVGSVRTVPKAQHHVTGHLKPHYASSVLAVCKQSKRSRLHQHCMHNILVGAALADSSVRLLSVAQPPSSTAVYCWRCTHQHATTCCCLFAASEFILSLCSADQLDWWGAYEF